MSLERNLTAVPPILLTANGTTEGVVLVADTCGFYVKQQVILQAPSLPPKNIEVKRVVNATTLWVGTPGPKMTHDIDISAYTVAAGSFIFANEQPKATLSMEARMLASYRQEPSNSWSVTPVDCIGAPYDADNPLPVALTGSISIGQVEIKGPSGDILVVNPDGSINVAGSTPGPGPVTSHQNITVFYNESSPVASGALTTILTYTVGVGDAASLQRILASGENIARYDVLVNGTVISTQRTYFGSALDVDFNFVSSNEEGPLLASGDIVTVQVLHNRPMSALFEATLELILAPTVIVGESVVLTYNEVSAVSPNVTQNVVSYTVPVGKTSTLQRIFASGENIAKFEVFVGSIRIATKRTYFGGELNDCFEFTGSAGGGLALSTGQTVVLKVFHTRPGPSDFEGTIEVVEF